MSRTRKPAAARQRGFTLIELMAAVMVSSAVVLPALALTFSAMEWRRELNSQIMLNQQARAAFDILGDGARLGAAGNDGVAYAYGIRGREDAPSSGMRSSGILQYSSNGETVTGDRVAPQVVACTGAGDPLPDCASAADTVAVSGYVSRNVTVNDGDRSIAGRTAEVMLTLTDPFQAQREEGSGLATQSYRMIYAMRRDEDDP